MKLIEYLLRREDELASQNEDLVVNQNELESSQQRYARFYDSAPIGYLSLTASGNIESLNLQAASWLGQSREDIIGRPLVAFLKEGRDLKRCFDHLRDCRPGEIKSIEVALRNANPEPLCVQLITAANSTEPSGFAVAMTDVTERRKTEALVHQAWADLEQRVQDRTVDLESVNRQLRREFTSRRRLQEKFLQAVEEERRRIGQNLHDNLGQQLIGAAYLVKGLELKMRDQRRPEAKRCQRIRELIERAIDDVRATARGLTTMPTEDPDLASSLQSLAQTTEKVFNLHCDFQCTRGIWPRKIPRSFAAQLYRIAQEAITNAIKHGATRAIRLRLTRRPGSLQLLVANTGRAFDPKSIAGLGLRGMEYRANLMGGKFSIQPMAGGGTQVSCSIPLPKS